MASHVPSKDAPSRFISPVPYLIRRASEFNPDTGRWADRLEIGEPDGQPHAVAAVLDEHNDVLALIVSHKGDDIPPDLVRSIAIAEYQSAPRPLVTLQWPEDAEILLATDIRLRARNNVGRWGTMYVTIEATLDGLSVLCSRVESDLSRVVVTDARLTPRHRENIADLLTSIASHMPSAKRTSSSRH